MLRAIMTEARAHLGRLISAGVAIVIATAFLAATLLSTGTLERTAYNAILAAYPNADVIVSHGSFSAALLDQVRQESAVAGADGRFTTAVLLAADGRSDHQSGAPIPETAAFRIDLERGRYPDAPGQIAVTRPVAERLGLDVGSTLEVRFDEWNDDDTLERHSDSVTVTGIYPDPGAAFDRDIPGVFATEADLNRWSGIPDGEERHYRMITAQAAAGTSPEELRDALWAVIGDQPALLGTAGQPVMVRTADQYAADVTAEFTSDRYLLAAVLVGFGAVALFAAGMVISNTFAVLVAQRTRQLALLRCVGATRRQVHRGVLVEAAALGLAASVAGIAAGIALAQAALVVLGWFVEAPWLPSGIQVSSAAIVVPVLAGTLVTLTAALSPARAATRVAPLAALRPPAAPSFRSRASVRRMVVTAGLLLGGGALLLFGVTHNAMGLDVSTGLGIGVVGGAISFIGVIVGAVVIVPPVVSAVGRLLSRQGSVPARIAAVNAARQPRRTASTAAALLIGVTLVAMMSVGAASAQATLDAELDERFPVDVVAGWEPYGYAVGDLTTSPAIDPAVQEAAAGVAGVALRVPLREVRAELAEADDFSQPAIDVRDVALVGVDPEAARAVVRTPQAIEALAPGVAVLPDDMASYFGVSSGDRVNFQLDGTSVELSAVVASFPSGAILVTESDLAAISPDADVTHLWLGLERNADPGQVIRDIQAAVSEAAGVDGAIPVMGAAAERSEISRVLDTMLAVVTGLLAVAVIIALIGVSNTLSLSVIERTRESATLRALGLTRRQLRATLAIEGMIVAGVAALLGIVLGVVYGWLGTLTTIGAVWDATLTVPWERLAMILIIAVGAGLLASTLPGRRAAKAAPVTALTAE